MLLVKIYHDIFTLQQGNFFANLGSIVVFAVFGTVISALLVGGGIYMLGKVTFRGVKKMFLVSVMRMCLYESAFRWKSIQFLIM